MHRHKPHSWPANRLALPMPCFLHTCRTCSAPTTFSYGSVFLRPTQPLTNFLADETYGASWWCTWPSGNKQGMEWSAGDSARHPRWLQYRSIMWRVAVATRLSPARCAAAVARSRAWQVTVFSPCAPVLDSERRFFSKRDGNGGSTVCKTGR